MHHEVQIKEENEMACFLVPTTEAIVTTIVEKNVEAHEKKGENEVQTLQSQSKLPFSRKLKWLNTMLWGGAVLLAFEHVWHGEVVPFFPFLTAASNPSDAAEMLHEMSTTGVLMAVLVTVVWIGMVAVSNIIEKRTEDSLISEKR